MIGFLEFLNEARIIKDSIKMDQDDIDYLQQFPQRAWPKALMYRYSKLLLRALGPDGNLKRSWNDIQDVVLPLGHKQYTFRNIDTKIVNLAHKLKKMGFDLRDPHEATNTLASMKLMNYMPASRHIDKWKNSSTEKMGSKKFVSYDQQGNSIEHEEDNPKLNPGFSYWTPNKIERSMASIDDQTSQEYRSKWAEIASDTQEMAQYMTKQGLNRLSRPENKLHINYYYWVEKENDIIQEMIKRIKDHLDDPRIMDRNFRYKVMLNYITSISQTGHAGRRTIERAIRQGVNISDLLKQGYSVQQVASALPNAPQGQPMGKQTPLYQAMPIDNAPINRYRSRTINSMRQRTNDTMKNQQYSEKPGRYRLESFKEWFLKEDQTHSLKKGKPENYLDGIWRELGIDINTLPDFIETGWIEMDGLYFNTAVWRIVKPISERDPFIRLQFHKSLSPNLDQGVYIKREDGKMMPYNGRVPTEPFLVPAKKFADMWSDGWKSAVQGNMGAM